MLPTLPEGKLICAHSGKYTKWFISNGSTKQYLPKSQLNLAEKLAYKKYLNLHLSELKKELRITSKYIDICSRESDANNLLVSSPEFQKLLYPYFSQPDNEIYQWSKMPYDKNPLYQEALIHKSISGNLLRSKSEAIIDMLLYQMKIPYRYECQLVLGDKILHPDFTIRHPITGKFFYWEHFGQMDSPEYYSKTYSKLQLYTSHGIIPSFNLIATYETRNFPLSANTVKKIIEHYFT